MKTVAIAGALLLGALQGSFAADVASMTEPAALPLQPSWALQITPFMWAAGLEGQISPFRRAPTLDVDKSFSDVLDELNFGGFINVWGRYERFVFSADAMLVDTTDSEGVGPLPAFQIPGFPVTIPAGATVSADVDSRQITATLQGGYRLVDADQITVDALAGGRIWYISTDVTVTATIPGPLTVSGSHDEDFGWVDPVVGVRLFIGLTDALSLQAQADVGGFGVGSDMSWSALATVNYVLTDNLSMSVGYKVLDVEYDSDGHVLDTQLSGPVAGVTYRF